MDFLTIIDPDQGVVVFDQWIPRARLGLHLRLSKIYERITFDDASTVEAISAYLEMAGLNKNNLTGLQQLQAFLTLSNLNRLNTLFAYQKWEGMKPGKEPPYTYPGRVWALYVHKLASRYGWARDDIFNLWPEEVSAYFQEILIAEYDEADERRSLTKLAYRYDEATKQSKFIPIPRPSWMVEQKERKKIKVKRALLPVGNVIDLTYKTEDDFIQ